MLELEVIKGHLICHAIFISGKVTIIQRTTVHSLPHSSLARGGCVGAGAWPRGVGAVARLGEFMILQKFELCKVQLTHGANQLYIHGNEKLNCLGSTATSRSQIKSFTVCFLYANSSCRLRLPCKGYNSIRTLPGHSAAMSRCAADWAGAPLPWRGAWWCFTHHPPAPGPARV